MMREEPLEQEADLRKYIAKKQERKVQDELNQLEEIERRTRELKKLRKGNAAGNRNPNADEDHYQRKLSSGAIAFDSYGKAMLIRRANPDNLPERDITAAVDIEGERVITPPEEN